MSRPTHSVPAGKSVPAGLAARQAALAILSDVLRKKRPLDVVAAEIQSRAKLEPRDAGFARSIATTALRHFGQLEALIRNFVPKAPPPHKAGPTLEILLAGACELLFLKVAPHAAVDAANRLAQGDSKAVHFKALINAVLRRISREGVDVIATQDAAALNTPDWLWPRWVSHYGEDAARAIADAHLGIPPLDLTMKSPNDPYTDITGAVRLADGRLRLADAGRIEDLSGFRQGRWWVQDFAASLPVRLLGNVAGKTVIDLCAAPGGKTAQLAAMGATVTAVDISAERLLRIRENLERLQLTAELVTADARAWQPAVPAPCVLLDAPCTATGTIRRHPDLPWSKGAADLVSCESLQSELLDAAAGMTAPGGLLVYAVCSLEPEEGEEQIAAFLRQRTEFARVPVAADEVFDAAFVSPQGDLKTLPSCWSDKGGMDGFYAARLRRRS
ncbi:MAG TPA: transcription antitermination factor NusB [Micropepsaceae bacterium]|nr:transcription antitermination factor NusB [Micropepsaceae bacterium]